MNGKCKCGEIAYSATGKVLQVLNCHCTLCRAMNGSAFSTYVVVPSLQLTLLQGEASLAVYAATERAFKYFCKHCGTALFNTNPDTYPGLHMLYLGTLADAAELAPAINIYCDSKLGWVDRLQDMRHFAQEPRR